VIVLILIILGAMGYVALGVATALEYPKVGKLPKTRFGRFLFRMFVIFGWLPIVMFRGVCVLTSWLFS